MHTKGPWIAVKGRTDLGSTIATINPNAKRLEVVSIRADQTPDAKATMDDANLIAAAPDLLEALEDMCGVWKTVCDVNGHDPDHMCQYTKAIMLIAKVKGE